MPGSRPAEAFDAFAEPLNRSVSCITNAQLKAGRGSRDPGKVCTLTFPSIEPISIRGTDGLCLTLSIDYEIIDTKSSGRDRWKVRTHGYKHQVVTPDMDEVVLFHWHPKEPDKGRQVNAHPHIHIGPKLLDKNATINHKAHVPSGRVCAEDVILFLIEDCNAQPLRQDWKITLTECRDKFRQYASWGTGTTPVGRP